MQVLKRDHHFDEACVACENISMNGHCSSLKQKFPACINTIQKQKQTWII